jgi:hypothetical protein
VVISDRHYIRQRSSLGRPTAQVGQLKIGQAVAITPERRETAPVKGNGLDRRAWWPTQTSGVRPA